MSHINNSCRILTRGKAVRNVPSRMRGDVSQLQHRVILYDYRIVLLSSVGQRYHQHYRTQGSWIIEHLLIELVKPGDFDNYLCI